MQYEYRTVVADRLPSPEQLTQLGGEGWLLAALVPHTQVDWYYMYLARQTPTSRAQDIAEALRHIQEIKP